MGTSVDVESAGGTTSLSGDGGRKTRNFILIEFNAWECAGSEVLWAALITKIFDKVTGGVILHQCDANCQQSQCRF